MQRFLLAFLTVLCAAANAAPPIVGNVQPPNNLSEMTGSPTPRENIGVSPRTYNVCAEPFGGVQAKCFYEEWTTGALWSAGGTSLTVGSLDTFTATVTTWQGGRQLFIAGSRHYVAPGDIGKPLDIPGPAGQVWRGAITGVTNSGSVDQNVWVSTNAPFSETSTSVSLKKDNIFTCATAVGLTVQIAGSIAADTTENKSTIASCTSANQVTMASAAGTWVFPTTIMKVRVYYDDSTAMNAAVLAATGRQNDGDRVIYVSRSMAANAMDERASQVVFKCERGVTLYKQVPNGSSAQFRRFCTYPDAPPPGAPVNTMTSGALQRAATAGPGVIVDWLGASTGEIYQSPMSPAVTFYGMTAAAFQAANPDIAFTFNNRAIGGQNSVRYDSIPTQFKPWYSNQTNTWLSYILADTPDVLIYELSANEGLAFSLSAMVNTYAKTLSWTKIPDFIPAFTDEYSLAAGCCGANNFVDGGDFPWRLMSGLSRVYNWGFLDFRQNLIQVRDGFDPRRELMLHAVPPSATVNTPWTLQQYASHSNVWGAELKYAGTAAAFCTAAGNEIRFGLSGNTGSGIYTKNVLKFGCDPAGTMPGSPGPGSTYYQVDLDAAHPGMGAVALVPTVLDTWTVSGGNTVAASTLTPFLSAHTGTVVTIPNAAGSGQPCITTFTFVSSSAGTLSPGCTNGTYTSQPLLFGNARVFLPYNEANDASGNFFLQFWTAFDSCGLVIQGRDDFAWTFPCAAFGGGTRPQITTATNIANNNLTFNLEAASSAYKLYTGSPFFVVPSATDRDILGGSSFVNGDQGNGWCGGSGSNHAGCEAAARVYGPVLGALDLRIPATGVQRVTPTTGQVVGIKNRTTWVNLTPAGTLASLVLTMPAAPRAHDQVMISSSQVVTSLTVNGGGPGQSVVGGPSAMPANTSVAFRYDGTSKAWTRVQ